MDCFTSFCSHYFFHLYNSFLFVYLPPNMLRSPRMVNALFRSVGRTILPRGAATTRCLSTKYTESHEWISVDGSTGTIGISDHAQKSLGDVVYVELPEVGDEFEASEAFGSVESVKAASDVYVPVSGAIVETNGTLEDTPGLVNESAGGDGWFVKIKIEDASELDGLMDEDAYLAFVENES